MVETDHLKKTLEYYRKLRQQKIDEITPALEEIRAYEVLIRKLADDAREPANITPFGLEATAVTPAEDTGVATTTSFRVGPIRPRSVRPDEFFGLSQTDAAKAYLKMVGHAISMDELLNALQAGGAKVGGVDPKRTLQVSLKANPRKEFVWPSKDHVSLAEFYQGRK